MRKIKTRILKSKSNNKFKRKNFQNQNQIQSLTRDKINWLLNKRMLFKYKKK